MIKNQFKEQMFSYGYLGNIITAKIDLEVSIKKSTKVYCALHETIFEEKKIDDEYRNNEMHKVDSWSCKSEDI